jgi:thiol-disulfide isomerase/thioredoxin
MIHKILICAFILFGSGAFALECKEATWSELKESQKDKGSTELVFFASWCSSCKESLSKTYATPVLFISVFDEKADSERVLKHFVKDATCYFSKDIDKHFKVKTLPMSLKYDF